MVTFVKLMVYADAGIPGATGDQAIWGPNHKQQVLKRYRIEKLCISKNVDSPWVVPYRIAGYSLWGSEKYIEISC